MFPAPNPRRRHPRVPAVLLLLLLALQPAAYAQTNDADVAKALDELMAKAYPADEPGAAVIVVREGQTLLRKGYGMADLELGVRVEPDMVFRLGSITKQFTAVAILLLAEQGKLAVTDDITKFLPDYPTGGKSITVEHLLTHTSGIKSYTSMQPWRSMWRKDFTVQELIDLFKNEPADFAPGERWSYNNSGYILLGAIIEKVSGQSYEEFVRRNIFEPLGMKHSYYGSATRVIPRRVPGYSRREGGFENAQYLSMTQPYAAGSLLSTVDDLALWDAALYDGRPVRQASLARAFTPYVLKGGGPTDYGYGWARTSFEGHDVIEHGGGIHGFSTYALRIPDRRVFVAVLTNRDSGPQSPEMLALKLAAIAVGKPIRTPVAVALRPEELAPLAGVYEVREGDAFSFRVDGGKLIGQRNRTPPRELFPLSATEFFVDKDSLDRIIFTKDAAGKVTSVKFTRRRGTPLVANRTDKPLPKEDARVAITLAPEALERFVGEYQFDPNFSITVTRRGGQLMQQATGQPEAEIYPESEKKFFLKVVDAQLEFQTDASGAVTGLVLHQNGRQTPAKKIR